MRCHPSCVLPFPDIGNPQVKTSFNGCQDPLELTVTIRQNRYTTSTFIPSPGQIDTRSIGSDHWPMRLRVQFEKQTPEDYYVRACVVTERTGEETCFMDSMYGVDEIPCLARSGGGSSMPLFLFSSLLAVLFIAAAVTGFLLVHRLILRYCSSPSKRSRNDHKQSQCTALLPEMQHEKFMYEDTRLTVIEEEKEELYNSPCASSSGVESLDNNRAHTINATLHTVITTPRPPLSTFRPEDV